MFCPNRECPDYLETGFHAEFVAGVAVCPTCGERLVDELTDAEAAPAWTPEPAGDSDVEPVFESWDPTEVPVIKSLLEGAGIPYATMGEERFDAFRGGRSAMRFNPRGGSVCFLVPRALADDARALLAHVDNEEEP